MTCCSTQAHHLMPHPTAAWALWLHHCIDIYGLGPLACTYMLHVDMDADTCVHAQRGDNMHMRHGRPGPATPLLQLQRPEGLDGHA
jgi:hypothetical protein